MKTSFDAPFEPDAWLTADHLEGSGEHSASEIFMQQVQELCGAPNFANGDSATAISAAASGPSDQVEENNRLYIGNLPPDATEEELERLFSECGQVHRVEIVFDKNTGRSKSFGFVTMATGNDALAAMQGLNGTEFRGRSLTVNMARLKLQR